MSLQEQIKRDEDFATRNTMLQSREWYTPLHRELYEQLNELVENTLLVATPFTSLGFQNCTDTIKTRSYKFTEKTEDNCIYYPLMPSQCHDNVSYLSNTKHLKKRCYGYALSPDGLWREHTWGINQADKIVETTVPRIAYVTLKETSIYKSNACGPHADGTVTNNASVSVKRDVKRSKEKQCNGDKQC